MSNQNNCSMCPFFCKDQKALYEHLLRRHRFEQNFQVHCSKPGCGASFRTVAGLRTHHYRKHQSMYVTDEDCDDVDHVDMDIDHIDTSEDTENDNMKKWQAKFILMLVAQHNLTQKAIEDILDTMKQMNMHRNNIIKERLLNLIPSDLTINFEEILSDGDFNGLETQYMREKYFEKHLGYVKPVPVKLGEKRVNVKVGNSYRFYERDVIGYIVPFFNQLQELLNMSEVQDDLGSRRNSNVNSQFMDFQDGAHYQMPYIMEHEDALLFCLYHDDFEIVNPIGSHRKKHKLSVFYWSLLNIGPENRFKIQATQLLAVAKSLDLRKYGIENLLEDFVNSMKELYKGRYFNIGDERKIYHGILFCAIGDTPAAQLLGGFKEGVGMAEKPCRSCEVRGQELPSSLSEEKFAPRDENEHLDRCKVLDEIKGETRRYWSKQYGITRRSVLLQVPDFAVTKCILHDPMHVLLEGVVKMEIQLMLDTFIEKKKYFSLSYLNTRIRTFSYSVDELADRPQEIDVKSLKRTNTFPMTAIETKTFMELLPFMIADKINQKDYHWDNFIRLVKITSLVLSPIASDNTISDLKQLIYEHNSQFSKLYPEVNFTPKLHYMCHFPSQISNFGPGRNHWCVRMEAKHNLFKNKKWKNFKSLPLSTATYHQQWMCLRQLDIKGGKSEVYLYAGDSVGIGVTLEFHLLDQDVKNKIEVSECEEPKSVLQTSFVSIRGISYRRGCILLYTYNEDELTFCELLNIYVSDGVKYFHCRKLKVMEYLPTYNAFACALTEDKLCEIASNFHYKWPQTNHVVNGQICVMLTNVDFCWC